MDWLGGSQWPQTPSCVLHVFVVYQGLGHLVLYFLIFILDLALILLARLYNNHENTGVDIPVKIINSEVWPFFFTCMWFLNINLPFVVVSNPKDLVQMKVTWAISQQNCILRKTDLDILYGVLQFLQYFISFKMCRNEANNHTFTLFSEAGSILYKDIFPIC